MSFRSRVFYYANGIEGIPSGSYFGELRGSSLFHPYSVVQPVLSAFSSESIGGVGLPIVPKDYVEVQVGQAGLSGDFSIRLFPVPWFRGRLFVFSSVFYGEVV